jgi:choice-of-anchor A domain-containing protein
MKVVSGTLAGVITLLIANGACAAIVGPASGYNVFIFGDGSFMSEDTDTMGNLAAGGNVSLTSYQVAQGITGNTAQSPNPARLVVGGALTTHNGGQVGINGSGTIYYGSTAPVLNNNGTFTAAATVANQTLVNFASSQSLYTNYSQQLGAITGTGSTTLSGSSLTLTGKSSGLNVFTVNDGSNALTLSSINISAPTGSTVLINVVGTGPVTFGNSGGGSVTYSGGITGAGVLYNIESATSVQLFANNVGFNPDASILAPDAGVTGGFGAMSGELIAGSYSGQTQFNDLAFTGTVPLPGTFLLFGSGLLCLLPFARRYGRQSPVRR